MCNCSSEESESRVWKGEERSIAEYFGEVLPRRSAACTRIEREQTRFSLHPKGGRGKKRFCVNASAHIPFEEYRLLEIIKRNKFTRKIFNSIHKRVSARLPTRCITRIHFHFHSSNFNVTFHPDEDKRDIAAKRFNLQGWTRTASFLLLPFYPF